MRFRFQLGSSLFIKTFLTINPGIFIYLGSMLLWPWVTYLFWTLCMGVAIGYIFIKTKRYRNTEIFLAFSEGDRYEMQDMIKKTHVQEVSTGNFHFTPLFYSDRVLSLASFKANKDTMGLAYSSSGTSSGGFNSSSGRSSSSGGGGASSKTKHI